MKKKMREREKRERGELKASHHFFLLIKYPFNSAWLGDFVANPFTNYKNNIPKPITLGAKKEENQKRQKNKKWQHEGTVARGMNSVRMLNSGSGVQFHNAPFFLHFLLFFPSGL